MNPITVGLDVLQAYGAPVGVILIVCCMLANLARGLSMNPIKALVRHLSSQKPSMHEVIEQEPHMERALQALALPESFAQGALRCQNGWQVRDGKLIKEADVDVTLIDGRTSRVHVRAIYTGVQREPYSIEYTPLTHLPPPSKE